MSNYTFNQDHLSSKYAGGWQIGGDYGLLISVTKKPRWLTRKIISLLLEWEWITYAK